MRGKILQRIVANRYTFLLAALILILCVVPLLNAGSRLTHVLHLSSLTLVFIAAVYANRSRPRVYYSGIVATVLALPVIWSSLASKDGVVSVPGVVIVSAYFVVMAALMLVSVFRDSKATHEAILGAISAYLLIGLAWAFMYSAAVQLDPEAIQVNTTTPHSRLTEGSNFVDYVYFSFVTMSTLGYGDFSPITPLARTLAWLQSVVGQFYFAALVARLISAVPSRRGFEQADND